MSIEQEGLKEHVNRYFKRRHLSYTLDDVIRLKEMRIGGQPISMGRQLKELGMNSRTTLYNWHSRIDNMS